MGRDHSAESGREPCPHRIIDDVGGAFAMGVGGGSIWHMLKGLKNSPKGARIIGGIEAVRTQAPRIGGSFGVWGGLFSTFDCALVAIRKKEDPWNSIMSGALTGGLLQIRHGPMSSARHAAGGALILAMIEGMGIMITRSLAPPPPGLPPPPEGMAPPAQPSPAAQPFAPPTSTPVPDLVMAQAAAPPEPEMKKSSWYNPFGGSSKPAKSNEVEALDLTHDKFAAPPIPKELQGDFKFS